MERFVDKVSENFFAILLISVVVAVVVVNIWPFLVFAAVLIGIGLSEVPLPVWAVLLLAASVYLGQPRRASKKRR